MRSGNRECISSRSSPFNTHNVYYVKLHSGELLVEYQIVRLVRHPHFVGGTRPYSADILANA